MNESGKQKLRSLLFDGNGGNRELVNLKLFPGTARGLTASSLGEAAADALRDAMDAWENNVPSRAPSTGLDKRPLLG